MIPLELVPMTLIGSKRLPLRPSQLFRLLECPMQALISISDETRATSVAADTGSMIHGIAKAFHESKDPSVIGRQKEAVRGIAELKDKFPFAIEEKAIGIATSYMNDPKNINAVVLHNELPVEFELDPWHTDPTGEKIFIQGTCDQIRSTPVGLFLWDIKTGRQTGWGIIHQAAIQLAAYYLGAVRQFPNLKIGGIIRTEGYSSGSISPDGVFCPMSFVERDCEDMMIGVRIAVANLRRNEIYLAPGLHCNYCPANGVTSCKPRFDLLKKGV